MLGRERTIAQAGCAMTSVAMAISKISDQPLTPRELDAHLDKHKGYSGDALDWDKAGAARGLKVNREKWSLDTIDAQLDAGKPVVVGVDYKQGSNGGPAGTDHWICVTRKDVDEQDKPFYWASDPGTGKEIKLYPDAKGRLQCDGANALGKYKTTGQLRSFEAKG
ncbi:MAG: uncharacterized protein H6Q89_406 [Myxococcaceae bacterium]|nr:uncharacterized protein [Myxococcaceae bacterium]